MPAAVLVPDPPRYLNNMLAIVADLEDGPAGGVANGTSRGGGRLLSLAAHLARVKAISKEAFAHSRPPFPDVVAVARVPKDPSSDPIFGVTLAMIPGRLFERSSLGPGLRWRQVQLPDTLVTINDLNFDIAETRAGLEVGGLQGCRGLKAGLTAGVVLAPLPCTQCWL